MISPQNTSSSSTLSVQAKLELQQSTLAIRQGLRDIEQGHCKSLSDFDRDMRSKVLPATNKNNLLKRA